MGPSKSARKAKAGESQVATDFQWIGWEPLSSDLDYGTDRYVIAQDELGSWIGLVGVQVKTGPYYFERPTRDDNGKVSGWWSRNIDNQHFDDWTSHELPYLLVLHNEDERVSYWVHVTSDQVQPAGENRKIRVPSDQKINEENRSRLEAVASQRRTSPDREETGFTIEGEAPEERRLHFALVAPRLVAPHAGARHSSPIDAVEGLALLAQGRFRDLMSFSEEHESVPNPQNSTHSDDWTWRLVRAFWDWATTDICASLQIVFDSAPGKSERAASGVLLACALRRVERYDDALSVLETMAKCDDLESADLGWVLVQKARALAEAGDFDGSRSHAIEALECFDSVEDDLTISALRASAARQIFATEPLTIPENDLTEQDSGSSGDSADQFADRFNQLMTAVDTPVSWWRSQTVAQALSRVTDDYFESWAEYQADTLFSAGESATARDLFAAELNADITGDHGTWKAMSSLAGRHRLVRASTSDEETGEIVEGVDALRRSGNSRHLELALKHLRRRGPVEPMARAVRKIPPVGKWTHSTASGNLTVLELAGDFLDERSAAEMLVKIARIACLADLEFIERTQPTFSVGHYGLNAVKRLLSAAPDSTQTEVAAIIAAQREQISDHPSFNFDGVFSQIEFSRVDTISRDALWEHCQTSDGRLGTAVLGWFVDNGNIEARSKAVDRAESGDHRAFAAIGDITKLDQEQAARLITRLEILAEEKLANERASKRSIGGFDAIETLALINLCFPDAARWDLLEKILADPLVDAAHKRHACTQIVRMPGQLPPDTRDALADEVDAISATSTVWGEITKLGGMGTALAISIGAMDEETANLEAVKHSMGTPQQRSDAALLLGLSYCPHLQPALAALVNDDHHYVRATAAEAIGTLLITMQTSIIQELARKVANSDGMLLPSALLAGMRNADAQLPPIGIEFATALQQHASAQIRRYAHRLLHQHATS